MRLPTKPKVTTGPSRLQYRSGVGAALAITLALLAQSSGRIGAQSPDPCAPPGGNPIVCENQQPGAPSTEWDVAGAGDDSIQGFATDISVNRGQSIGFKIDTDAASYQLDIYRMGYYGGLGARKVASVSPAIALPQGQPACLTDAATGLVDCGNWATSASWDVPATAVSGIYFARAVRLDTGGASHILFVVRDDGRPSDLLFQTSDTTWQAYNQYGGNSLYVGSPAGRAYKVSYNRPITVRGTSPEDSVFNSEYPMVRWLEANGYDVSYSAGVDTDRHGSALLIHKALLSVGHDEYWSGSQRSNVEAARAAGVHLAFFSGNEVFWKTRWEPSTSADATPYRTLVSYKETHANAKIDPSAEWTGTWRDPRFSPPSDGDRPENALTGTIFTVNSGTTSIQVPATAGRHRFWRNTDAATLAPGASLTLPDGTLGYEWDEDLDNGFRPAGLARLSDTTVNGVSYLQDYGSTYAPGTATHALTLYRHSSGALVFGAGTVQWSWGLDGNHDRGASTTSLAMQQATVNLFADMSAQPLTLQAGLTTASPSTDVLAPTSTITSPAHGSSAPAGSLVTISGTAVDAGGGSVGGVEVSVDGGLTWRRASGGSGWTYSWATGSPRTATIFSRAVDDNGNIEQPSAGITVTVAPAPCPCSLWMPSQGPPGAAVVDSGQVELGTRFRADVSGYVTGIRFFKHATNTGPHTGTLWSATGTRLSTVTFSAESASGWQQATFPSPIAVDANAYYVVSYNTAAGFYAADQGYFTSSGVDAGPLHAPSTGGGPNGVFAYGPSQYPNQTFDGSNYWVDVVFVTTLPPDTAAPTVSVVSPANGLSGVRSSALITVTFNENVQNVSAATVELTAGGLPVAATVTYASATQSATLTPAGALAFATTYTARVRGGASGVTDLAGNPLAGDHVWTFTTAAQPPIPPDEGPGGPILIVSSAARPFSRYYAEILRAEGLNDFLHTDITALTPAKLAAADVLLLGQIPLSSTEADMLAAWVGNGGKLIAMRPDKKLAGLLGIADTGTTLPGGYLRVDTSRAPGAGIAGATMQFHSAADLYTLSGATEVATLFASGTTATTSPAVTIRAVGGGGQAGAFAYDLAQSVVYTRQGNPGWAGQERDGNGPIRSNDLFFGGPDPDWIDFDKIAIPQADEQQRLLANMIVTMAAAGRPLPRFWYFPRDEKAVVVMTGDDHGSNGTAGRFDVYKSNSPANCRVNDWECVRATSYIYPTTPISNAEAAAYAAEGFEIAVHVTTGCQDYTAASLQTSYAIDLAQFAGLFPDLPPAVTNRTHCVPWSDYDTQPQVALANGIRLDTNYYYFPGPWVLDRPGFMTGSGMPMRFANADGTLVDVYQAATQLTDESGQTWPHTIDTLLDRAIGPEGYFGFFVANMHTDVVVHDGSEAIVASALARSVPVISARQLLTWLDGRNASVHAGLSWLGGALHFTVTTDARANGLRTMLPAAANGRLISSVSRNGQSVPFDVQTIKGIDYAVFDSPSGNYEALYTLDGTAPAISNLTVVPGFTEATISWATSETASGRVEYGTSPGALTLTAVAGPLGLAQSVVLSGLTPATTYYFRAVATDAVGNAAFSSGSLQTLTPTFGCPCTIWSPAQAPTQASVADQSDVEVGLKFKPLADGYVTAIRFYKGSLNNGAHIGNLWSANGVRLATVTFANESASGWQEATLAEPVALTANTTYVVSYHSSSGGYAADVAYFQGAGVTRGALQALAEGISGSNGVFRYGPTAFPTQSYQSTNYWVDLVFVTERPVPSGPPDMLTDTTAADFAAGTVGAGTFVARAGDGEVILAPTIEHFGGTSLPAGWASTPWGSGGATTAAASEASVDGALFGIESGRQPDQTLEFVATFSSDPNQHAGFALAFQENRWAMFSTGSGGGLLARTHDGATAIDTPLPGNWLNGPHRFRIEWGASSVTFSIDGALVASHFQAVAGPMRPMFSDFTAGGNSLLVDAVQSSPYAQSGVFTSRVLDAGAPLRWASAVSTAQVPAGTTLSLSIRFGETPEPDAAWSPFVPIPVGNALLNATSRYVQYRAALTGTGAATPVLQTITVGGSLSTVSPGIFSGLDTLPGLARAAGFTIRGWAVDTRAATGTGIGAVDVFAAPSAGGSPIYLGTAALGGSRPDVALALGNSQYTASGFAITISLPPGQYTISATPRSSVDAAFGQPATVQVSAISGTVVKIQSPAAGRLPTTTLTVRGYAADLDASFGSGVDAVQVWAAPTSGAPFLVGVANSGESTPELSDRFGPQFTQAGFSLSAVLLPGTYTITTRAHSTVTGMSSAVDTVAITVPASATELHIEAPTGPSLYQGFTIAGWAIDSAAASGPGVDAVHVWGYPQAGGAPIFLGYAASFLARPDVAQTRGSQFLMSGFSVKTTAGLAPGAYQIVTYARSTVSGQFDAVNSRLLTVLAATGPVFQITDVADGARVKGYALLNGFAFDPRAADGLGIDAIHMWVYPQWGSGKPAYFAGFATYGTDSDPVLGARFGGQFDRSGVHAFVQLLEGPGTYMLAFSAHSTVDDTFTLVTRLVTIPPPQFVFSLDAPQAGASTSSPVRISGWAIDRANVDQTPDGSGIEFIQIYAYPVAGGAPTLVCGPYALDQRPDVAAIFGSRFVNSGFNCETPMPPGTYDLAVYLFSDRTRQYSPPSVIRFTVR